MTSFQEKTTLGRTRLQAGRLGISSSFGAPASAFEEAFERGCNYWTWGTFVKGRSPAMGGAIRNIIGAGKRDSLILSMLTYAHSPWLTDVFFHKGLRALGTDHADILLLGWFNKRPARRILEGALALKEKGLVRFIGITSHNRKLFPELEKEGLIDVYHLRYNAVHRGAEEEVFPRLDEKNGAGVVNFTATAWGKLLNPKKMPPGEPPPSAADCYRFVLSRPEIDICMMGAKNQSQLRENLAVLDSGPMTEEELERMRRIGGHIYG